MTYISDALRQQVFSRAKRRCDDTGTILNGLTPTGRATVKQLQMNDLDMIEARKIWVEAGLHPPK